MTGNRASDKSGQISASDALALTALTKTSTANGGTHDGPVQTVAAAESRRRSAGVKVTAHQTNNSTTFVMAFETLY